MPTAIPDLILMENKTATGAGTGVIGLGGPQTRYAKGVGVNRNQYPRKFKVRAALTDSAAGATATLTLEHSDDASSWTTIGTMALTLVAGTQNQGSSKLFSTTKKYVRGNVTALTGGSAPAVTAYLTAGTFGA